MRRTLLTTLALLALGPAAPAAAAPPTRVCAATASWFESARRVEPLEAGRRLDRLLEQDPACTAAPAAALGRLEKDWGHFVPTADRSMPKARLDRAVTRIVQTAELAQALLRWRTTPERPRAALVVGRLYEGLAAFLDQMGGATGRTFVMRQQAESLYHTRAVDLRELLKIRAEGAYELSIRLLAEASSQNETLLEARERLETLKDRYAARAPAAAAEPAVPTEPAAPVPE